MDKAAKRRTWIGIIVLLFANSAAGGAEWCSSALADIAGTFPEVPYSVITESLRSGLHPGRGAAG